MMKLNLQKTTTISNKVIFLFGPTAVGKTDLITNYFLNNYEVVNADSMQVYRYLDIGSAKPSLELMEKIPHHLVNILDPWTQFTVGQFIEEADKACAQIWAKGKIPVLTGGTAYYFKHFLYGLSSLPPADLEIRDHVANVIAEKGEEWAYKTMCLVDEVSGARINKNDLYRISRVLEVFEQTGKPLSSFEVPTKHRNNMQPLIIGLYRDKDELQQRIALRVELMLKDGLVEEMKTLFRMGAEQSWPGMQGIGYKEFFEARESGESSLTTIAEAIITNSRKYAKRQLTFFKSFANCHWVNPKDTESLTELIENYLAK